MTVPWWERGWEAVERLVAPRRSLVRLHRRRLEQDPDYALAFHTAARLRGYAAASSPTTGTPWEHARATAADAELIGDLGKLRDRTRALTRDNPLACGIVGTFRRQVVGTGLRAQARTGDPEKDAALEAVAPELLDACDRGNGLPFAELQALLEDRRNEDGDVLLRLVTSAANEPAWIEVVEGDRLSTPMDATPADPAGRIVAGVERDRFGIVQAYWVARRHPGETTLAGTVAGPRAPLGPALTRADFDRVLPDQSHLSRARVLRPGQSRGLPLLHACLTDLHDLDMLLIASLKRAQMAACLALFLTSGQESSDLLSMTAEDYGYRLNQKIEPGMIFRLFPGEKAETINPATAAPDLERFVFLLARRIGASVGLSPQSVLRAWEGATYSGARTIKIDDRQTFRAERAGLARTLTWIRASLLQDALLRGEPRLVRARIQPADLWAVEWIGDEEQWVDPIAEAQAVQLALALGLTSLQIECGRLGRDWQDVLRQRAAEEAFERDERGRLGLPPRTTSPAPPAKGAQMPPETEEHPGMPADQHAWAA